MKNQDIIRKISRRFFFAIVFLAFFSIISFILYFSALRNFSADINIINHSTQQRFLSQQVTILAQHLASEKDSSKFSSLKAELNSVIDKMEQGHQFLTHNPRLPKHYHSDEIMAIYFDSPVFLDKKVHAFMNLAAELMADSTSDPNYITEQIFSSFAPLLFDLDHVVQQYQAESQSEKNRLLLTRFLFLVAIFTILFFTWRFVFSPATRELRYYVSEIIKKDNDLLQANIDLERKVEERTRKILEKENTYKTLVENMNEGLAHYNPEGVFTFVNDKFCEILEYKPEELIGHPIYKLFFADDVEKMKTKISERKKGIREQYEWKLPTKTGREIWAFISASPIYEKDKVTGSLLVLTNITKRKETELSLAELHQFNGILLNTIPLGMQVVDIEGNVLYSNQMIEKLAGFDTKGKKCWSAVHDEKIPCSNCLRGLGIEQGKINVCEMQKVFDGKMVHIYQAGINFHHTKAVLELFIDITQLKETEKKLLFKNRELQTFITRASHDMRSPVANILGLIYFLKKELSSGDDSKLVDYIEQSARKMDQILLELINIGKVYNNPVNVTEINLNELTAEIIKNQKIKKDFESVNFLTEINSDISFSSDRFMVNTILQNLLDNAARYRKENISNPSVSVRIGNFKHGINIRVSDNGQGMVPEVAEKAFEMFFRGNYRSSGTGLGLYMVKTFVEKLGGNIGMKSETGSGTSVTVFLPNLTLKRTDLDCLTAVS